MKYAILGDVHANLTALDAVLDAVDAAGVDRIVQKANLVRNFEENFGNDFG